MKRGCCTRGCLALDMWYLPNSTEQIRDEYVNKFEEKKYIYTGTVYSVHTHIFTYKGYRTTNAWKNADFRFETLQANLQVSDQACVLIPMFAYDCSSPQYIIRNVFRTRRPVTGQSHFLCAQSLLPPNSTAPSPYLQREVLPGSPEPHTYACHSKCR